MHSIIHVIIKGRVQGVGYRAWTAEEAEERGLSGWVRNRREGWVEAIFAGTAEDVEAMIEACRVGPYGARVDAIERSEPAEGALAMARGVGSFIILSTV